MAGHGLCVDGKGLPDETLDIPLVVAFAGTAIAIPDQVVGQEPTEQRCALAPAVGQNLCHQTTVVVIDDRPWHRPEERKCVDVAIDPSPDKAAG